MDDKSKLWEFRLRDSVTEVFVYVSRENAFLEKGTNILGICPANELDRLCSVSAAIQRGTRSGVPDCRRISTCSFCAMTDSQPPPPPLPPLKKALDTPP